jgi:hypothetical protein
MQETFGKLDKDSISIIFKELSPQDALSLCRTNARFAEICRNEDFFRLLMRMHFPFFPVTDTPKQQYIALTNGIIHKYVIFPEVNHEGYEIEDNNGTEVNLTNDFSKSKVFSDDNDDSKNFAGVKEYVTFEVGGLQILGQEVYLLIESGNMAALQMREYDVNVFMTYEDACDEFAYGHYYSDLIEYIFEDLRDYDEFEDGEFEELDQLFSNSLDGDDETLNPKNSNTKKFYEHIRERVPCRDLTRKGVFSYIMKNGFFIRDSGTEYQTDYQIVKVTIRNESIFDELRADPLLRQYDGI